jgi:hypothetical protein
MYKKRARDFACLRSKFSVLFHLSFGYLVRAKKNLSELLSCHAGCHAGTLAANWFDSTLAINKINISTVDTRFED